MTPIVISGPQMIEAMKYKAYVRQCLEAGQDIQPLDVWRAAIRAQLQEAAYQAAKPEEFRELDKALGEMMRHAEESEGEGGEE